ncbi:hypothetical protein BGZ52_000164 [Haplosporangium bisporale]|nr:hypothetical protein BGZ52_000164 [Haplosporangium bisporale]
MFSKHPTEPQKDANNTTDLLNATIHMASVIATLSWHHTTVSPPRATPDLINSAPSSDTKDPLQVGKKPLDEEEASTKAPSSQLNHHLEDQKGESKGATMRETVSPPRSTHALDHTINVPSPDIKDSSQVEKKPQEEDDEEEEEEETSAKALASTSTPRATHAPDLIITAPSPDAKSQLQAGKKPQEEEEEEDDDDDDYEDDDDVDDEEDQKGARSKAATIRKRNEDPTNRPR